MWVCVFIYVESCVYNFCFNYYYIILFKRMITWCAAASHLFENTFLDPVSTVACGLISFYIIYIFKINSTKFKKKKIMQDY